MQVPPSTTVAYPSTLGRNTLRQGRTTSYAATLTHVEISRGYSTDYSVIVDGLKLGGRLAAPLYCWVVLLEWLEAELR